MPIIFTWQSNPLAKNFKRKSFEYWKELSIIVGNDFAEGVGPRMATQLKKDIDDDVEDVRETIVSLDDDDDVEEISDHEDFPETPVQSRTNGMTTNPLEKSTSAMPSMKKKKTMVDTVESIGIAVKKIGAAIVELRKPSANPHIREVYRALQQVNGLVGPIFMQAYNEMMSDLNISEEFLARAD
ncbi:hypothetical protein AMTRI_Chr02g223440 [Amborella trichopoda]